jgi:hypothetical protein
MRRFKTRLSSGQIWRPVEKITASWKLEVVRFGAGSGSRNEIPPPPSRMQPLSSSKIVAKTDSEVPPPDAERETVTVE